MLYRMPEIHIGAEAMDALVRTLESIGPKRLFIVTGPHVSQSEAFRSMLHAIGREEREVCVYSETSADPSLELVDAMAERARAFGTDCVLGFGGGSPLDAAKAVAILATYPLPAKALVGINKTPKRKIPLLMIPTTAGTASEVTIYSILTNKEAGIKEAICSSEIIPDYAFLIPEVTYSMPPSVTAATGIDALCHAAEAYLSLRRNPYSDVMALAAVRLIAQYLPTAFAQPHDAPAREQMLLASLFAGLAFGNASVTAVHAFAYPIGGMHGIPHGVANSLMFDAVFRHNLKGNEARMEAIAHAFCGVLDAGALVPAVQNLKKQLRLPQSLQSVGIPESDIEPMATSVMSVTRLLHVNPSVITIEDARRIYREAWLGAVL
jgi:alcohol dehydrogenase